MERTGHRRLASLHSYQHLSEKSREMVSDIITGTNKTDEEDVKPSLKLKRMPCKQLQEGDDSEDDNVDLKDRLITAIFAIAMSALRDYCDDYDLMETRL